MAFSAKVGFLFLKTVGIFFFSSFDLMSGFFSIEFSITSIMYARRMYMMMSRIRYRNFTDVDSVSIIPSSRNFRG